MIRINQLKLPIEHSNDDLANKIASSLKVPVNSFTYEILKKSIDSRKKPDLYYVYSILVTTKKEENIVKRLRSRDITIYKATKYQLPEYGNIKMKERPVIVGAGPAGLFCALSFVDAGFSPILLERGKAVEEREADVKKFWKTGLLDPSSNAVFGEGGAGTFSDGKLNTSVKDPSGRILYVLRRFCEFGAKQSILYENKPHIGTDELIKILKNIRTYLTDHGCDIRFGHQLVDYSVSNEQISSVKVKRVKEKDFYDLPTSVLVLAPGHGARDTFQMLKDNALNMESKPFAVGFRVEHPQKMINQFAYGPKYADQLPASPYKVTSNFPNNRGVYSFCMCPGGYVVNSSSEENHLVVNGMSYSDRSSSNANSAIIISINENDFDLSDPLSGLHFQEELERKTFEKLKGKIPQQLFGDFKNNIDSKTYGEYESMTKGERELCSLRGILPEELEETFILGMEHFGNIIPGFDRYDAILSGTETRTSSPVRIFRDKDFLSNINGLYPCGEGAGYAGGITSAAMDGVKVAEAIIKKYCI